MKISKRSAQQIVEEIGKLVKTLLGGLTLVYNNGIV